MSPCSESPTVLSVGKSIEVKPLPTSLSPEPEPSPKRRKIADDNPIPRCELCKQRKVRSSYPSKPCVVLLCNIILSPTRRRNLGITSTQQDQADMVILIRSNVIAVNRLVGGAVEMAPTASTRNARSPACAPAMGASWSNGSTSSRRSCGPIQRFFRLQ